MVDRTLDAVGKKCPLPVLMTRKELKKMSSGEILEVYADDVGAKKDIPALLHKVGDELVDTKQEGSKLIFVIKKS